MFDELYIYNYFPTDVGEAETRTKEISTLKMAMIHAIMGEDTKALTKADQLQAFFKDRYNKELNKSEETSWDSKYRKLLNKLKGTDQYNEALKITHRAKTGRKSDIANGVLLFGKKGTDFVFKLGHSAAEQPTMLTAEQALSLFEANIDEEAFETSKGFDAVYQSVKLYLFRGTTADKNEKERINALAKVKLVKLSKCVDSDYIEDLVRAIEMDALSGNKLRYINKLTPKEFANLIKVIDQSYLNRIITTSNSVDDGEEVLILAEEFIK